MKEAQSISAADFLAISSCSAEFGYLVDHGRAAECVELFTEDARLITGPGSPRPGTLNGIASIRAFLVARQAQTHVTTRHVATNFRVEATGTDSATLTSLMTVYRSDDSDRRPSIAVLADVKEKLVRLPSGEWKIAERTSTPIFVRT